MNADGSEQQLLWAYPFINGWNVKFGNAEENDAVPAWSPDGKWLLFHVKGEGERFLVRENNPIYLLSVEDGSIEEIATGGGNPVWVP